MELPNRLDQIWSALESVTDPEIDESVVSLEFVSEVKIDENNRVQIEFRLPTYWCAPNFAFLMASDMRDAISELDWVREVSVRLVNHFSIAFATSEGMSVDPGDLKDYLRKLAGARRNAAFNGFICRSLLAERVGAGEN